MSDVSPMGGTELLSKYLHDALPELTSQVQIILSRPEQVELEDKPRILWLHDLPQDPASRCLADASYRTKFNRIVFVSHWQQQMYNAYLGIPFSEGIVIKNGVPRLNPFFPDGSFNKPNDGDLRFVYTSTPHRGLAVLAAAAAKLAEERQDWQLDVYSSLNLYGWGDADKQFEPLYESLRANPCVVYHGTQPNAVVRQAVQDAHVCIYPSIYQETSCLALIEAMMAGCLTITNAYGALIETCGEWALMMPFNENPNVLAGQTLDYMRKAFDIYPQVGPMLVQQSQYFQNFWSFESRVPSWQNVLQQVVAEGAPVEKLIIG